MHEDVFNVNYAVKHLRFFFCCYYYYYYYSLGKYVASPVSLHIEVRCRFLGEKKKKKRTVMLYMCTYTCGIWDVITWIRVQQCLCKAGNHFQLQVGPKASVKVPLCFSIVV